MVSADNIFRAFERHFPWNVTISQFICKVTSTILCFQRCFSWIPHSISLIRREASVKILWRKSTEPVLATIHSVERMFFPVAMLVKQHVATEVWDVSPPGGQSLMCESWMGKVPRPQTLEHLLFLLCLYMFITAFFLCYLAWCEWEIPAACNVVCISHGNTLLYWAFLLRTIMKVISFLNCTV